MPGQLGRALPAPSARAVGWEIGIVLALSLGRSGVYAIVDLIEKITRAPLRDQVTTLNPPLAPRPLFDLTYQLLGIGFALVPVLLVFHLLWIHGRNPFRTFGLDLRRPARDLGWGALLFLAMGLGTLLVYAVGRSAGVTTAVVGSAMNEHWWTTPVLILSALRHSLLEEVIVVAWLIDRLSYLQRLRSGVHSAGTSGAFWPVNPWAVAVISSLVRASYHLYQGLGPGIGNLVMGLVFAVFYLKYRRVMPLVVAHLLLDVAGFVGYPLLAQLGWFGT
ncbi:CPBP family intramembrane metalloprotease [Micrococcus terreus]|uniref:CPBP family intramembrane glutamic endopeptidase n=1 Tax=Micrococcus terreus TaxID=574650 RepID=UPI0021A8CBF4|nr:CPBP family intramembrane metalloprotease [Micrococcus terreus]